MIRQTVQKHLNPAMGPEMQQQLAAQMAAGGGASGEVVQGLVGQIMDGMGKSGALNSMVRRSRLASRRDLAPWPRGAFLALHAILRRALRPPPAPGFAFRWAK